MCALKKINLKFIKFQKMRKLPNIISKNITKSKNHTKKEQTNTVIFYILDFLIIIYIKTTSVDQLIS